MKCPKCGKELENDAKFCRYCGKEIEFRKEKKKRKGLLAGIVLLILFLAGGVYALQSGMMDQLRKESVNIVGNTCGNLSSEGAMAQQGKWLYYSKGKESSSVPVDYCPISQIKKVPGSKIGFVTMKSYKTIYIDPDARQIEEWIHTYAKKG